MEVPSTLHDQTTMSMESFHCDDFELRVWFDSGQMNNSAFLKAVQERGMAAATNEDDVINVALTFGGGMPSVNYHAHLKMRIQKDGSGRLDLDYHSSVLKHAVDEQPPYVEDCANWLADFFVEAENLQAHLHVNYTFGKEFVPVVTLPFPLTTSEATLAGALVSGLALILPGDEARTVIIQNISNGTHLFLRESTRIDLRRFDIFRELEKLSIVVNTLVKRPTTDDIRSTPTRN